MRKLFSHLCALAAVALSACGGGGGGGDPQGTPLPVGEGTAQAYNEAWLAARPDALLHPQHLAVTHLEAVGDDHADSGGEGVDVLAYHVPEPLTVTLSIDPKADRVSHLRLTDGEGNEIARHARGQDAITATLQPGKHQLHLHHAQAGQAGAQRQTLFIRLVDAPGSNAAQRAATRNATGDASAGRLAAGVISTTCIGCSFDRSDLSRHDFTNATLTDSTFVDAILDLTIFVGAQCERCDLSTKFTNPPRPTYFPSFWHANLSSAWIENRFFVGAEFSALRLYGASLIGIVCQQCYFSWSDLTDARLFSSEFHDTPFDHAIFRGADLATAVFDIDNPVNKPLPLATFRGADFTYVIPSTFFEGADLSKLDLSGAIFKGVDLSRIDLSTATFTTPPELAGAILSNGQSGAKLAGIQFANKASFAGMDMRLVDLTGASLYEADLQGANLGGAQLRGADLSYANLAGAKLVGAQAGVAPGSGQAAAQFFRAYMPNADLTDADLRSVNLAGVHLYGDQAQLVRARLDAANLDHAVLAGAVFGSASLNGTSFDTAVLVNARFDNANLTNAKLSNAYLQGAAFDTAAAVPGLSLNNAAVSTAAGSWQFTEQDGTPFTYGYGSTALGIIGTSASPGAVCPNSQFAPCNTPDKLTPLANGPYPPVPACVPKPPKYDNCLPPKPGS